MSIAFSRASVVKVTLIAAAVWLAAAQYSYSADDQAKSKYGMESYVVTLDSLEHFVSRRDAEIIRAFENWSRVNRDSLVKHAWPFYEFPELEVFFRYRLIRSGCLRLQIGEFPDSVLNENSRKFDREHNIGARIDSVFSIPENTKAWSEFASVCPFVTKLARDLLDSMQTDRCSLSIGFNFMPVWIGQSGDTDQRKLMAEDYFEEYFIRGYYPSICWVGTFERAKSERVIQIQVFDEGTVIAAVPLIDRNQKEIGEVSIALERRGEGD